MTKKRTVPSPSMVYGKARPGFAARKITLLRDLKAAEIHLDHCVIESAGAVNDKKTAARADVERIKKELGEICQGAMT